MTKDRLEKALEAIRSENAGDEELARTRSRVWENLGASGEALCTEFQLQFVTIWMDGLIAAVIC